MDRLYSLYINYKLDNTFLSTSIGKLFFSVHIREFFV